MKIFKLTTYRKICGQIFTSRQTTESRQDQKNKCKEKATKLGTRLCNCIILLNIAMTQYTISTITPIRLQRSVRETTIANNYNYGLNLVCPMGQCEYIHYYFVFDSSQAPFCGEASEKWMSTTLEHICQHFLAYLSKLSNHVPLLLSN